MYGPTTLPPSRYLAKTKVWIEQVHIKDRLYVKEEWKIQFKGNLTLNLCDNVRPISKWFEFPMEANDSLFMQVQPYIVTNLKLVWNLMMIVSLLILGASFL
jgi:hypothetical protein